MPPIDGPLATLSTTRMARNPMHGSHAYLAWVAIEVDASGVAEVGPVELEVGTPFRLHAVLEALFRDLYPG